VSIIQVPPIEAIWQPSFTFPPTSARSISRAALPYRIAFSISPIWAAMLASLHHNSEECLDARRQRGVARGQGVVERKVPLLRLEGKRMTQQEHRQHHVRLFDHLLAVDVERMIKEQQRVVVVRRVLEVPGLAV